MEDTKLVTEIRDLTREAAQPQTAEPIHFVVAPMGMQVLSLEKLQFPHGMRPDRITAAPKLQDAVSFCSYVNTFKDDRTRLFADAVACSFTALIDYHGVGTERAVEFLSHRATLTLKKDERWNLWLGQNGKLIPQAEFAEFLEDNRADIVTPDAATMLEIAMDLQAKSDVNFASKIKTQNGQSTLVYDETITTTVSTGRIVMPEIFVIRIPVFFGEAPIEITARLRFRISEGKLKFQFNLYRPVEILAKAFDVARAGIAEATKLEVLLGTL